ncbi:host specificity protein J [Pseudomonas sp. NA-150]|uniref:host specificity protein J n=1 Tax=Pseudomonas sp. NA-150 TaxID=3367525 RepID=UPI0037C9D1B0
MGAVQKIDIHGAKSGESNPKTPIEAPDSLRSVAIAKILIAVGEGEFAGVPSAQDIYLDNTPLADAEGNINFPNVTWEWRSGAVDQSYIPGIPSIESETSVGVELRGGTPWVKAVTNIQLSAVRLRFSWPALQSVDDEGNINGYRIEYAVDIATDGGAYQEVLSTAVDGKTTTVYERTHRLNLPPATSGWLVRVRRITANQNNNKIADTMQVAGYTEVIDAKLRYPNTALLYIEFSAEQFSSIPAVTVQCKGRKWPVPSNYDPEQRTYTGIWDGTFKDAWTDNPTWMTYGISVNDRFGLGKRIKAFMLDKWELYRISQYCDQLVPDGKGGTEPRFKCDLYLQSKADAWSLLRDISAIYRGITYWAQGQVFTLADMPREQDFDFAYTRANVIDGKFETTGAEPRTIYSRALVSYDNPGNNYDTDVTAVTDLALQRRFRDNPVEIAAIGCTRESEAQRRGKWALLTNSKNRGITFRVGMDGRIPLPGYVIPVADSLVAGREIGGRISAVSGRTITLDRDTAAKAGDLLILNLPAGTCEGRTVQSVSGRDVTVTTEYSVVPESELVWCLDADDLAVPLYRVTSVSRPEPGIFEITAIQYDPSKFAHIDTGAKLEDRPISVIPISVVPPPASVSLSSSTAIAQGLAVTTMTIAWPAVTGAVAYDVQWRKDSGNWISVQRTGTASVDIVGIYAGAYLARVRAVSAFDISSIWANSILTQLKGKEGLPPAVTSLTTTSLLFGIGQKWTFPAGAEDTQRTEIWYGPTDDLTAATKLSDLAYPQNDYVMQGLLAGVRFFFWARLIDRTGNIGPWYPAVHGVQGSSSADAGPILTMIAGQIGKTELGQDLNDQIDKIPGLQNQIDALDGLKGYDPDQTYTKGQMIVVDGRIFQAEQAVPTNTPPPNALYWDDVGDLLETANALAEQVATNTTDITELDGVVTAQASSLQALRASFRSDDGSGDMADALKGWNNTASIAQETSVRASQDLATAQQLTVVTASVNDNSATVTNLVQSVATDKAATATQITQLNATVGKNTADIQTTATAYADTSGKLTTMWSVKMQVNANGQYIAAGIGLGIENTDAGLQSQFLVSADRFAIVNTLAGGTTFVPFAVQGGQVFINQAFIQDASISMAKITTVLQSDNYVAGQTGWAITRAGNVEFNSTVSGGGRLTMNNRAIKVFDANGVLRVQLGDLSA